MNVEEEVRRIFAHAVQGVRITEGDATALANYGAQLAILAGRAKFENDLDQKAALLREMQGFEDAISAMAARYGVKAGVALERAEDEARAALFRVLAQLGRVLAVALA